MRFYWSISSGHPLDSPDRFDLQGNCPRHWPAWRSRACSSWKPCISGSLVLWPLHGKISPRFHGPLPSLGMDSRPCHTSWHHVLAWSFPPWCRPGWHQSLYRKDNSVHLDRASSGFRQVKKKHTSRLRGLPELEPNYKAVFEVCHAKRLSKSNNQRNIRILCAVAVLKWSLPSSGELAPFRSGCETQPFQPDLRQFAQAAPKPWRKMPYQPGLAALFLADWDLQHRADIFYLDHSTDLCTFGHLQKATCSKHPFSWWHLGHCHHQDLALMGRNLMCPKESAQWFLKTSIDTSPPST